MRKTLKHIVSEYGTIALALYLLIFALVLGGTWLGLLAGWAPASAGGTAGTLAAAYIITKLTQPLRIGATVLLTPVIARLWERARSKRPRRVSDAQEDA
jgi:hypothetical protein